MSESGDRMARKSLFAISRQNRMPKSCPSEHITNDLDITTSNEGSVMPNNFGNDLMKNLNIIRELIAKRSDPYAIFEKIVNEMSENYTKCCEIINKYGDSSITRSSNLNDQLVSLENKIITKINDVQKKSDEKSDEIDLKMKCKEEVNILWISFTDPAEINDLRMKKKSDLLCEAKKIFNRMNIKLDKPHKAIMDVIIQKISVKTKNSYENELILGIKFTNASIVNYMKRRITEYGKNEFINENYDLIRYSVRSYWSLKIWKLLRVCYDLKNFKLIEKVNVTDKGIEVTHRKSLYQSNNYNERVFKKLVLNENDLNVLRSEVNDVCKDLSAFQFYNGNYLKLEFDKRKEFKLKFGELDHVTKSITSPVSTGLYSELINCLASSSKKI